MSLVSFIKNHLTRKKTPNSGKTYYENNLEIFYRLSTELRTKILAQTDPKDLNNRHPQTGETIAFRLMRLVMKDYYDTHIQYPTRGWLIVSEFVNAGLDLGIANKFGVNAIQQSVRARRLTTENLNTLIGYLKHLDRHSRPQKAPGPLSKVVQLFKAELEPTRAMDELRIAKLNRRPHRTQDFITAARKVNSFRNQPVEQRPHTHLDNIKV